MITRSEGSYPVCVRVCICVYVFAHARLPTPCGNLNNGAALARFGLLRLRYEDKSSGHPFSRTELLNKVHVLNVVLKSFTSPLRQITVTVPQAADCRTMSLSHGMGTNGGKV